MQFATPRQPPPSAPALSLRSRAGRVTPLPDLDVVELGRQGLLSACITSPRVSRRQATLLRSPGGALRVVSQGANPTAVVTRAGAILRLAGGAGTDVAAGDMIVLCPGRLLRDMGGAVDEDEAFTLVEADIDDLPAALREIARLRAALAARPPPAAATSAPEPAEAPIVEAAPAPAPMEAEPAEPAPEPAPEPTEQSKAPAPAANERPAPADNDAQAAPAADAPAQADAEAIAVDAVATLTDTADLEAASLTHTDDGSRFVLRWRGGGASCVQIEDGAWRVVDVSGAATAETRVGRALALAAALADADDVPRSGVDGAMAAFLSGATPATPSDDVEDADDDNSAGDFEEDATPGTAMLVDGALASDGEASCYDGGSDDDDDEDTAGARYVERLLANAAREGYAATSIRWDGTSQLVGAVSRGTEKYEVRVDVSATREAVILRASYVDGRGRRDDGVNSVPVLTLLAAAAAAPGAIACDVGAQRAAVKRAADALEPRAVADALLHAVATATTSFAYAGLRRLVEPVTLPLNVDTAAVDALATARAAQDSTGFDVVPGAPAFYDSEAGLVYGRVRRATAPGQWSSSDVAFAAEPTADGVALHLDPARSWTSEKWDRPLLAPAAVAFAKAPGILPVDVCALRTALLALPDLGASAVELAFSVIVSESGIDATLPRLFAEAAAAGAAPRPGDAFVSALASVFLDPAAAKTQEDHAAATVADALDGISDAFDEAEGEVQDQRDAWEPGEDCNCWPERGWGNRYGCNNCGDYHCDGCDHYDPADIECDCAADNNPLPAPAAFVKDRLGEVDALLARGTATAAPDDIREALLVGVARGLAPVAPAVPQAQECGGAPPAAAGRAAALHLPLTMPERAAVLRAIAELDGKTSQKTVRKAAECILGAPEGSFEAKKLAIKEVCIEEMNRLERAAPRRRVPARARADHRTPFKRALDAAVDSRLSTLTDGAVALARTGRSGLLARLLLLRPTAPFAADAIAEAMAVSADSKPTLVAAVNAAAAKLTARIRDSADFAPVRANLRELLARGWLSWETVKEACKLDEAETPPHTLDLVDFALETARHASAPAEALIETRRAAVAVVEARLATTTVLSSLDLVRALKTLRIIQGEDVAAGAAAAARRVLYACAVNEKWVRWPVVCRAALEIDGGADTVNAARGGAETLIKRDVTNGSAVIRDGIAKGCLPTDRCIHCRVRGAAEPTGAVHARPRRGDAVRRAGGAACVCSRRNGGPAARRPRGSAARRGRVGRAPHGPPPEPRRGPEPGVDVSRRPRGAQACRAHAARALLGRPAAGLRARRGRAAVAARGDVRRRSRRRRHGVHARVRDQRSPWVRDGHEARRQGRLRERPGRGSVRHAGHATRPHRSIERDRRRHARRDPGEHPAGGAAGDSRLRLADAAAGLHGAGRLHGGDHPGERGGGGLRRRGPRRVRVSVGRLPGGRSRRRLAARDARRLRPQLRRGARGPGRRVHNRFPDLAPETRKRCGGLARRAASGVDVRHGPHEGRPRH